MRCKKIKKYRVGKEIKYKEYKRDRERDRKRQRDR